MNFRMTSFKRGQVLDMGTATSAEEIDNFVNERPNADRFHAHPIDRRQSHFLSAFRMTTAKVVWQKEKIAT